MLLTAAFAVNITAGLAFIAIGALLLVVRPPRAGIVWFGAYAVATGLQQALGNVGSAFPGASLALALSWAFQAVWPIALVQAASGYAGRGGALAIPFVITGLASAALLLVSPSTIIFPNGFLDTTGLVLLSMPGFLALAIASALIATRARRSTSPELRLEGLLLVLALLPYLAYTSGVSLTLFLTSGGTIYALAIERLYVVVFATCLLVTLALAATLWSIPSRLGRGLALGVVALAGLGAAQALALPQLVLFGGALRILAALLLGYGLLKFGLFDVEVKLKRTLDRGTLVAIFGAVFFLVEEFVANFVQDTLGFVAGLLAAALLLPLLRPLRAWTGQLAARAFPAVEGEAYLQDRKLVVYRTAAEASAEDGTLTPRERAMLDALVRDLGLTREQVERIEERVLLG